MYYTHSERSGNQPAIVDRTGGSIVTLEVAVRHAEVPFQETDIAAGIISIIQPPDGHGTVLGATLLELGNTLFQPSNAAIVVDFLPSLLLLEDLAEPVPFGLLLLIGGFEPTVPKSLTRSGAIGILEKVGDGIFTEGILFGVHALNYTGTTEDGKRVAIGNSNGLAASDSHGNNMQPPRPPPCIAVRIIGANYTESSHPVKPHGIVDQSGVTILQRLPTSPNVVYCET